MAAKYDPQATYEVEIFDVQYRTGDASQPRIYQPRGEGPFPALLDVHGGAWNHGDRTSDGDLDQALAAGGILVAAIDLRLAPEYPYPCSVQDVNYGARWLKARAADFKADASGLGALGGSSGGHIVELSAMRPHDARYSALPLPEAGEHDGAVAYAVLRSPATDPYACFVQVGRIGLDVQRWRHYFVPWDTIFESSPPKLLERGDFEALPPMLILSGADDDRALPGMQKRFAEAYRAADGEIQLEVFPDTGHSFNSGPQIERAVAVIKKFIARQLSSAGGQ